MSACAATVAFAELRGVRGKQVPKPKEGTKSAQLSQDTETTGMVKESRKKKIVGLCTLFEHVAVDAYKRT